MDLKDIKPGDLLRLKGFIQIPKGGGDISHCPWDMSKHGYLNLGEYEIIFVVPVGFTNVGNTEMDTVNAAIRKAKMECNEKIAILKARKRELEMVEPSEEENANS